MDFYSYTLTKLFDVPQLIAMHTFTCDASFSFSEASHDFWVFLYVTKGSITVTTNTDIWHLEKKNIIFCSPRQLYSVTVDSQTADLAAAAFICHSPAINFFQNRIFLLGKSERNLLAATIAEASQAFLNPLNAPSSHPLEKNSKQIPGAEQLIQLSLEHLFISLYRKETIINTEHFPAKAVRQKQEDETFSHILAYMNARLSESLTIEQICHDNLLSRSQLQALFRSKCDCGIIDYFSHMKINYAQKLIQEKNMNFTQIADALGYTSIHYFSRQFKKIAGISPSEYALSIKTASEQTGLSYPEKNPRT